MPCSSSFMAMALNTLEPPVTLNGMENPLGIGDLLNKPMEIREQIREVFLRLYQAKPVFPLAIHG